MSKLPDCQTLAALVSNVTRTMCEVTFVPGDAMERGESICRQMVMIPLRGDPNIVVVVASDTRGSRALGSAFFGCDEKDLTQAMVDDSISELLNMVAGQISAALQLDLQLGLPRRTTLAEIIAASGAGVDNAVLFRSEGKVDLWLWVFETHAAIDKSAPPPSTFRSILKRIRPVFSR